MKALKRLGKGFKGLWEEFGDELKEIVKYLLVTSLWTVGICLTIGLVIFFPIFLVLIPVYGLAMLFLTAWKRGSEDV